MRAKYLNFVSDHDPQILGTPNKRHPRKYRFYSPWFSFLNNYHQITHSYSSPLENIFLSSIPNLNLLNDYNNCFARDGLIPLLDFFCAYPEPDMETPHIVINKIFIPFVPKEWLGHISQYENIYRPIWKENIFTKAPRSKLVINFFPCSYIMSLENIEKLLKEIDPLKYEKIYIYKCTGDSYFDTYDKNNIFSFKALELINKYFNGKCELVFEYNAFRKVKFDETDYLEFNHNGLLWSDSHISQKMLSSGSRPIFRQNFKETDKHVYINQSLSHGIILSAVLECGSKFEEFKKFYSTLPLSKEKRLIDCKTSTLLAHNYLSKIIDAKITYLSE